MVLRVKIWEWDFPQLWMAITDTWFSLTHHSVVKLWQTRENCLCTCTWKGSSSKNSHPYSPPASLSTPLDKIKIVTEVMAGHRNYTECLCAELGEIEWRQWSLQRACFSRRLLVQLLLLFIANVSAHCSLEMWQNSKKCPSGSLIKYSHQWAVTLSALGADCMNTANCVGQLVQVKRQGLECVYLLNSRPP